jgi:hypothetical protein
MGRRSPRRESAAHSKEQEKRDNQYYPKQDNPTHYPPKSVHTARSHGNVIARDVTSEFAGATNDSSEAGVAEQIRSFGSLSSHREGGVNSIG